MLIALCSEQFVMVIDSTVMNVSIQQVIEDLDTKVSTMQLAIATYTLTTAALMLGDGNPAKRRRFAATSQALDD